MSRPSPFAMSWLDAIDVRWPSARRRAAPIALTLLLEIMLLLALLSLGAGGGQDQPKGAVVTTFEAAPDAASQPEPSEPEASAAAPAQPAPAEQVPVPQTLPSPPAIALPRPPTAPPVAMAAAPDQSPPTPAAPKIRAVIRSDMAGNRGPADTGSPGDSERIAGSGPNGEPLYAARWHREPTPDDYRGYFSRVVGSGWALINCQTEPEFRVDRCVLVDESDRSMGSAVLAMAWQFRVRPPRVGGRSLVGEWVRIRIDYTITRQ